MARPQTEPNDADWSTLARALHLEERFQASIFPTGGAQTSHFRKLCRLGMLEETGEFGHDFDGEVDREVPLYRLTEQGRTWVKRREAEADASVRNIAD